tara:strand:+ start:93 stop:266 length:174 start_codon:yes stop_codon:yes gene_type:complete
MRKIKVVIEATVSDDYRSGAVEFLKNKINSGDYSKYLLENGKNKGLLEVSTTFEDIN